MISANNWGNFFLYVSTSLTAFGVYSHLILSSLFSSSIKGWLPTTERESPAVHALDGVFDLPFFPSEFSTLFSCVTHHAHTICRLQIQT